MAREIPMPMQAKKIRLDAKNIFKAFGVKNLARVFRNVLLLFRMEEEFPILTPGRLQI